MQNYQGQFNQGQPYSPVQQYGQAQQYSPAQSNIPSPQLSQGQHYSQQEQTRFGYQQTSQQQYVQHSNSVSSFGSGQFQQTNAQVQYQQQQQFQTPSQVVVTFHTATNLVNVQTIGKQDPFVQFSTDFSDSKSFQKTFTHKDGGKSATWNQSFTIPYARELFVEVLDEEAIAKSELIGFAAIALQPTMNSIFTLYTVDGKSAGEIHISVAQQQGGYSGNPTRGQSYVNEGHLQRCKSLRKKAIASDVGVAAVGGILAVGAGLLGKKLYDNHQDNEQRKKEEEMERARLEAENKRLEEEKKALQKKQQQQQHQGQHQGQHHGHHQPDHCPPKHSNSSYGHSSSGRAREWDPVGTYAPGDRVQYNGATYVCLQGHTSNPTWQPGVAHSLWQRA